MKTLFPILAITISIASCAHTGAKPSGVLPEDVAPMTWDERRGRFEKALDATECKFTNRRKFDAIIDDLEKCVSDHRDRLTPSDLSEYPDDPFIIAAVEEAISAVRSSPREIGIGAVLVKGDRIIERAHSSQLGFNRTDLHAEMLMMTRYEDRTKDERHGLKYDKTLRVYSSSEPCPMCLTRLIIAGVPTFYGARSEEEGMAHLKRGLPRTWAAAARKVAIEPARSSPQIDSIAEALAYSYTRFEIFENLH